MFDAIFTASSGQSFSFGYKAGVLYSIDPIGDLPVELETSQGYQQVGATVESRSISGVTRTITGRILRNTAYLKRQLRDIFHPRGHRAADRGRKILLRRRSAALPRHQCRKPLAHLQLSALLPESLLAQCFRDQHFAVLYAACVPAARLL